MRAWPLLLGLVALAPLRASTADACTGEGFSTTFNVPVLPLDGSVAPINASIWIPPPADWVADLDIEHIVVEQDGAPIEVMPVDFRIDDDFDNHGVQLVPVNELTPGATVVVRYGEELRTRFTVGTERDDAPPAAPKLERVDVIGGYFGAYSCLESGRVTMRFDAPPPGELYFLASRMQTTLPRVAFGVTATTWLAGTDLDEGEHEMRVIAVDQAGNTSYTDVPEFTVPGEQSGCSAGGEASRAWPLVGMALLALRRRKRR
jgi:MYXO-CTERM domain-containing protein